jgi:hypothetical protein
MVPAGCLLLLLTAPLALFFPLEPVSDLTLGSPGDITIDNVGTILNMLIQSGGTIRNVLDKFSDANNLSIVQELVEESQDIIQRLQQGVSEINDKHKTFAGEALKDLIFIKLQLKNARLELNDLARRTVLAVGDLKAFSEAFFADDTDELAQTVNVVDLRSSDKMEYVREQMDVMKNLINDTNTKVGEVRKIYADIKTRFANVELKLTQYKLMVEHLLRNETSDLVSYTTNARAGVYSGAGVSTTICIVADVLGALGICSGINAAVVATSAISLEAALANMRANLQLLQQEGEVAIKDVQQLMVAQDEVEEYLYKEEQILVFWVVALDGVERKVANVDRLFLRALPVIRDRYILSLDELARAAQEYLDQGEL